MTVLKSPYYLKGQSPTWELAAYAACDELFNFYDESKNSQFYYFNNGKTNIDNLRSTVDEYISSKLYLQNIEANRKVKQEYNDHKLYWKMMTCNAIQLAKQMYPNNPFSMVDIVLTVIRKQRDYGHHNIAKFGITGLVIRIHDKIARAENLMAKDNAQNAASNESLFDTFLDIVGYSVIALMWLDDTFMYELERK